MAITLQSVDVPLQHFPWRNPPQEETQYTDLPQGEVRFVQLFETVDAAGAGNEMAIAISCTLPENFAYVLLDLSCEIVAPAAGSNGNNFQPVANAILQNAATTGESDQGMLFRGKSENRHSPYGGGYLNNGKEDMIYCFDCVPNFVLVPKAGSTGLLNVNLFNWTQGESGYLYSFFARFARYTINQAYNVSVNTPSYTRS